MGLDFLRIKEAIRENGHTYESLGAAVGLTKTSIARIAAGEQTPSFEMLKKIADTLGIEISDLFNRSGTDQSFKVYRKNDSGQFVEIGILHG